MEEQSRIAQLEEELRLRGAEIQNLQARLGGGGGGGDAPPDAQEESARESVGISEVVLAASWQEVESLKATVDSKNQEISEMKQKIQQASKENVEMMDTWKVSALLLCCPLLVAAGHDPFKTGSSTVPSTDACFFSPPLRRSLTRW